MYQYYIICTCVCACVCVCMCVCVCVCIYIYIYIKIHEEEYNKVISEHSNIKVWFSGAKFCGGNKIQILLQGKKGTMQNVQQLKTSLFMNVIKDASKSQDTRILYLYSIGYT